MIRPNQAAQILTYPAASQFSPPPCVPQFSSGAATFGLLFCAALTSNSILCGVEIPVVISTFLLFIFYNDGVPLVAGEEAVAVPRLPDLDRCWCAFFCIDGFGRVQTIENEDLTFLWLQCSLGYATTFLLLAL